jgi:maltose-binding protein MalE
MNRIWKFEHLNHAVRLQTIPAVALTTVLTLLAVVAYQGRYLHSSAADLGSSMSVDSGIKTAQQNLLPGLESEEPSLLLSTVSLWHAWNENESESLDEVIAAFQTYHPEVLFEVQYVPFDDLRQTFEAAASTGGGPSVLIGAADWGYALYDAEYVADLSGFATPAFLATINEAALGAVQYRDALIGLPQTIKGVVMFRNTDIITDAPDTYEELVAAAQAATGGDTVGANLERGFFFSAGHLHGLGGRLMNVLGCPAFNTPTGVEWLNLLDSFTDAGPAEYYTDNDVDLFKTSQAGIIIDGTWNMTGLAEAIGADKLSIDPWPTPLSGYVQTENIYLNANTEGDDQVAAWAFMEFFLSPEAQELLLDAGHIPSVLGIEIVDPLIQQAVDALAGGVSFPILPQLAAYWEPMDTALQSVFDGVATPSEALEQAHESVIQAIRDMGFDCGQVFLPIVLRE